jgi:glycosyltransferase involved in cell wall biosynthesis
LAHRRRRCLIILPTFNERANLTGVVAAIREVGHDVLVVDDNSPDGTGAVADLLAETDAGVQVIHRLAKLGLGSAYVAGFRFGLGRDYDFLVQMDADGSHSVAHLEPIIEASARSGGLSIGSRYVRGGSTTGWSRPRRLLSRMANVYCQSLLRAGVHDCTSGYRCFPRDLLERLDVAGTLSDGYAFQIEMVYRCRLLGSPVVEVPIRFHNRFAGQSKVSRSEITKALAAVPRLRLRNPALAWQPDGTATLAHEVRPSPD